MKNTAFDNNVVIFNLNVTIFGTLIDIVEIDKEHDFGAMETIVTVADNCEWL